MKTGFDLIEAVEITDNFIQLIGNEWFLLSAGTPNSYNTMTAAWGGAGFLWRKPVVFTFVRPQRHTFNFMEKNELFSMCFFDKSYKPALNFCGSHSGRDVDKAAKTGLTPIATSNNTIAFQEARLIIECRKIYYDDIKPDLFLDKAIDKLYDNDYHRMYVGEIIQTFLKKA
ncbi:MAG: flavin reductase [Bacteroidales bacterium]|nr:flavin reductase [Bacteroidales bacterium]